MLFSRKNILDVIQEEIHNLLSSSGEANIGEGFNPYRKVKDGTFGKGEAGEVYTLTKKGAKAAKVHPKFVKRGVVKDYVKSDANATVVKPTGDEGKAPAGRKDFPEGENIKPRKFVSKYAKDYQNEEVTMMGTEPEEEVIGNEIMNLSINQLVSIITSAIQSAEIARQGIRRKSKG